MPPGSLRAAAEARGVCEMQAVAELCLLQEVEGEPVEEEPQGQSWWLRVTALAQAAEEASSDRQPKDLQGEQAETL